MILCELTQIQKEALKTKNFFLLIHRPAEVDGHSKAAFVMSTSGSTGPSKGEMGFML